MATMPTRTDYAPLAKTFDRRYEVSDYGGIGVALAEFAAGASGPVLEVGCGTGHWLALLASHGHEVVGVEPAAGMRALARERLPGVTVHDAAAERLPLATGSVARVVVVNAFHHFGDRQTFLREARRVLAPGGGLLTVGLDPHTGLDRWCVYDYFEGTLAHDQRRFAQCASIRAWMEEAGFTGAESRVVHAWSSDVSARELFERGLLDKSSTSQLADLPDGVYERGVAAIRDAMAKAEERGEELRVPWDLRMWGTSARV
jgi:SAM-dependent methyltransferase